MATAEFPPLGRFCYHWFLPNAAQTQPTRLFEMRSAMPRPPEDYAAFCAAMRLRLEHEAKEIDGLLSETESDSDPVVLDQQSTGRLSRMDSIRTQAMAAETRRRRGLRYRQLRDALARLDAGEYGWCPECGEFIGEGRLNADPAFRLCVACAA